MACRLYLYSVQCVYSPWSYIKIEIPEFSIKNISFNDMCFFFSGENIYFSYTQVWGREKWKKRRKIVNAKQKDTYCGTYNFKKVENPVLYMWKFILKKLLLFAWKIIWKSNSFTFSFLYFYFVGRQLDFISCWLLYIWTSLNFFFYFFLETVHNRRSRHCIV